MRNIIDLCPLGYESSGFYANKADVYIPFYIVSMVVFTVVFGIFRIFQGNRIFTLVSILIFALKTDFFFVIC